MLCFQIIILVLIIISHLTRTSCTNIQSKRFELKTETLSIFGETEIHNELKCEKFTTNNKLNQVSSCKNSRLSIKWASFKVLDMGKFFQNQSEQESKHKRVLENGCIK